MRMVSLNYNWRRSTNETIIIVDIFEVLIGAIAASSGKHYYVLVNPPSNNFD